MYRLAFNKIQCSFLIFFKVTDVKIEVSKKQRKFFKLDKNVMEQVRF